MKRKRIVIAVIILILLVGVFVVIPMWRINYARNLLDLGDGDVHSDDAPTAPFYEGMQLLENTRWFPYFGTQAENIMDVALSPFMAQYVLDHHFGHFHYNDSIYELEIDAYFEAKVNDTTASAHILTMPEYKTTNPDLPLPEKEREAFCAKWRRFEELLLHLNSTGAELPLSPNCQ